MGEGEIKKKRKYQTKKRNKGKETEKYTKNKYKSITVLVSSTRALPHLEHILSSSSNANLETSSITFNLVPLGV